MEIEKTRTGLEKKLFELCMPVVKELNLSLYDLDYINVQAVLRLFINRHEEMTADLDDCMKVDRALSPHFEEAEWIPENITLEVSSPGVYRHLATLNHFKEAIEEWVQCTVFTNAMTELKGKKKVRGILKEVTNNDITLDLEGEPLSIKIEQIKRANVDPSFEELNN